MTQKYIFLFLYEFLFLVYLLKVLRHHLLIEWATQTYFEAKFYTLQPTLLLLLQIIR